MAFILHTLREEIFAGINVRELGLTKDYTGINFRKRNLYKDFAEKKFPICLKEHFYITLVYARFMVLTMILVKFNTFFTISL